MARIKSTLSSGQLATILILCSGLGAPAIAQEQTAPPNAGATGQVGEVVVTAQRKREQLQDTPLSVTALDPVKLVANDAVSLDDYFRSVPALTLYDNGMGFKLLDIRGVTTGFGVTPTVGVHIDDTPIGSSTAAARGDVLVPDLDPSDLNQIEVLKGPQGTLYGANSIGGILKYVTTPPDAQNYSGRMEVDRSTVAHGGEGYGLRGAVNLPVIKDVLAVRVSASTREEPGYIDDPDGYIGAPTTGAKDINRTFVDNGRIAVLFKPNDRLSVTLNALYQQRENHGQSIENYNFDLHAPTVGDLKQSLVPNVNYDHERQHVYNATVDLRLGWATLTSSTSYAQNRLKSDGDLTELFGPIIQPNPSLTDYGIALPQKYRTSKSTQEVRLAGNIAADIEWLTGVFYTRENSHFYQLIQGIHTEDGSPYENEPFLSDGIGITHYNEVAAFGDLTYHFTPQLSIQAGLRYSYNYQSSMFFGDAGFFTGPAGFGSGTSHEGVATFVVAPEYKINADTSVYARIASGYRPGGPNFVLYGNEPAFHSDQTVNYEAGVKTYLLQRKAYLELSGFYITWEDIQLQGINALSESFLENAGGALSRGLEASGQYNPLEGLTLAASLTYDDAHLTEDAPGGIYGLAGYRLPYTPVVAGQISADYTRPITDDLRGSVGGDVSYQGNRESDFQPSGDIPRIRLPAYAVVNLRTSLLKGRYSLAVFAKNVLDRRGFLSSTPLLLSNTGDYAVSVVQPRTVGFSLAAKF